MLVLSRTPGGGIVIRAGKEVVHIIVLAVHGKQVRMGFLANPSVSIDREEIDMRKQEKTS